MPGTYISPAETGFYYLQARYYDPEIGRFINADSYLSTGQEFLGYNAFAYCGNNPVNRVDADGEFWDTIFDLFSLGLSLLDVMANPSDPWAWAGLAGDTLISSVEEFMKFIELLNDLREEYGERSLVRKNGTVLLGPGKIPKSRHMLFAPLSDENINTYLVSEYRNEFPKEYIEFLKYSNGANLYLVKLKTVKVSFAHLLLVVFGLPLTPPFGRPMDMEEPYDLRVEDLARHKAIPNSWLKCGTYIKDYNFKTQVDIFIDTQTQQVFSVEKNKNTIVVSWKGLDECLCGIYTKLMDSKDEYDY